MKLKSQFFDFYDVKLTNFVIETIENEDNDDDVNLKKLNFDLDFNIFTQEETDDFHFITELKIDVNPEKLPGYYISAEFLFFFRLNKFKEMNEKQKDQYIVFTALPLSINSLRMELSRLTSRGLYGEYFLPSVDINELFKQKDTKSTSEK